MAVPPREMARRFERPDDVARKGVATFASPGRVRHLVLGEALLKDTLLRERRRADRSGEPFAVVLLDAGEAMSGERIWPAIVRALEAVRREEDAVGWLERGSVLALLMPEAPDARWAERVLLRVRREVARRLGEAASQALSIRLYAHGLPSPPGAPIPSVDLLFEAFDEERGPTLGDAAKRALDIAGSLALLALFAPVALAAFAAVKLTSPGPAWYRQVRVGRGGEPFTMLKFRSMSMDGGHAIHQDYVTWFITSSGQQPRTGGEVFKLTDDPRVTPVGRFLRKTSLDELPQFWNVLRGDMSLVGPRPALPFEVEKYQPWHRRRVLEAKPGITGLWQVTGRSRTTFDEMVRLDLRYARTRSLWTDIKILAATPRAMISGKGAL
jgi:lipopolysaccharide/colanic/teichoic acid biosynthesis glycosyltransferase